MLFLFLFLIFTITQAAHQQLYYVLNSGQSGTNINADFEVLRNLAQPRAVTSRDYQADGPMSFVKEWSTNFHNLFQDAQGSKNQQSATQQQGNKAQFSPRVQLQKIQAVTSSPEDLLNVHPPVFLGKPQRFNDKTALINDQFNLAQYIQKEAGYELGYHDPRDKNPSAVYSLGPVMEASSLFPFQLPYGKVRGIPVFVSPPFGSYTPFGWMPWKAPEKDIYLKEYHIQNPLSSFGGQFSQSGGGGGGFGQNLSLFNLASAFGGGDQQEKVNPSKKDSEAVTDYVDEIAERRRRDYHLGKAVNYFAQSIGH